MTLGGCSGSNTALLEANRALQEQNTKLVQDSQSLHTLNQQLQDGIASRDQAMARLQSLVSDLRAGRGDAEKQLAEFEKRMAESVKFGNIALDSETDKALSELAAQHPDLLDYDAQRGLVRFTADVTFDSGSDKVRETARGTLRQFAQILNSTARMYDVRIVGHTDAQPIKRVAAQHPTNWHLSCHRAISVLRELAANGFAPERGEAAGRGEFDPMVPNAIDGKSARNRRVEVYMAKPFRSMGSKMEGAAPQMTPVRTGPATPTTKTDDFMK
jgi:chemotaxis protein MotB